MYDAKEGSFDIKLKTDSEIYGRHIAYNEKYNKIGLYPIFFLSFDPLNIEDVVDSEDIFSGNELKETKNLSKF
jgi:hypothetical protein